MASLFEQRPEQSTALPTDASSPLLSPSLGSSPSLGASPRSALKGSRGSRLDRLRWDEEQLQGLEKEQAKRRKAKRAGVLLPLLVLLAVVLYALFVRWRK